MVTLHFMVHALLKTLRVKIQFARYFFLITSYLLLAIQPIQAQETFNSLLIEKVNGLETELRLLRGELEVLVHEQKKLNQQLNTMNTTVTTLQQYIEISNLSKADYSSPVPPFDGISNNTNHTDISLNPNDPSMNVTTHSDATTLITPTEPEPPTKVNNNKAQTILSKGILEFKAHRNQEAKKYFEELTTHFANSATAQEAHYYMGKILINEQKDLPKAVKHLNTFTSNTSPDNPLIPDALYQLVLLYLQNHQQAEALQTSQRLLNEHPLSTEALSVHLMRIGE